MKLKQNMRAAALRSAYAWLEKDPERNVHRLLQVVQELISRDKVQVHRFLTALRGYFQDPKNNWYRCYCALWKRVDRACLRRLFEVGVMQAGVFGLQVRREKQAQLQVTVPWALRLAAGAEVSAAALDAAVRQGQALGVGAFVLESPDGVHRTLRSLCLVHPDTLFFVFTGAAAVDAAAADDAARVGNLIVVPGIAAADDADAARAAALLRARGLFYGMWCRCTAQTADCIADGTLPDACIAHGAAFLWLADEPAGEAAMTPQQRELLAQRLAGFNTNKPLPILGLWAVDSPLHALLGARCPRMCPGEEQMMDVLRRSTQTGG